MLSDRRFPEWLVPLVLAVGLTGVVFLVQRRIDFNVADEGFLWEGVVLTAHGKVPLRDFYSYDPGRYLWAAAWAKLFGEGILALRLSTAIFQAGGLFCGLLAARRAFSRGGRAWQLTLVGIVLVLWMGPRHKLFEPAIAMAAVYGAVLLIERPSSRRHLLAGGLVGFAGLMGKNHGGYLLLAFFLLIAWLHLRPIAPDGGFRSGRRGRALGRGLLLWAGGIALGASPLLVMMAFVPRFFRAYVDSALFFVRQGKTNFGLPVPWPWAGGYAGLGWEDSLEKLALGTGFLLLPVAVAVALLFLPGTTAENAGRRALLLGGGVVGIFYLHHAFSRADSYHLSQSIHPALLALLGLPAALEDRGRRAAGVAMSVLVPLLAFLTLFAAVPQAPLYAALTPERPLDRFIPYRLAGDDLRLPVRTASLFAEVERQIAERVPAGEPVLLLPHLPGLYPVIGRESPVSDFYPIWPAQGERDEAMLREIRSAGVHWAVYSDYTAGEEPELQFPNTHPRVWAYLTESFERIPDPRLPRRIWLLHRG
jgi:hypothetical protein